MRTLLSRLRALLLRLVNHSKVPTYRLVLSALEGAAASDRPGTLADDSDEIAHRGSATASVKRLALSRSHSTGEYSRSGRYVQRI